MREIIHHQNAALLAFHIHTAFDAAERGKGFRQNIGADAAAMRDGGCGQGIQDVVTPRGGGSKVAEWFAPVGDTKARDFAIDGYVAGDPLVVRGKAIGFDRQDAGQYQVDAKAQHLVGIGAQAGPKGGAQHDARQGRRGRWRARGGGGLERH